MTDPIAKYRTFLAVADAGSVTEKPGRDEPACGWGMQTEAPYPLLCGFKEQAKLSASASPMW